MRKKSIAAFGCSFTRGYRIADEETWPALLGAENLALGGASNHYILETVLKNYKNFDTIIICWSNPVRKMIADRIDLGLFYYNRHFEEIMSFEEYEDIKRKYFESFDLKDIFNQWQRQIDTIEDLGINCIHTSAFGDEPLSLPKRWAIPILHKLAPELRYNIEVFEYDMLLKNNTIVENWANKNLNKNWKLAAIERNLLRQDSKNFLSCGHPSAEGHKIYAEYLKRVLP